ncbi:MAG: 6-phosphofructokinase [Smithella sp.]
MKIAVLTGGGDCPGLNGAIKWVTKTALDPHLEAKRSVKFDVIGIKDGWKGLVEVDPDSPASLARHTLKLDEEIVRTWDRYGGTNLGTSRTNPFNPKNDQSAKVLENITRLGIDVIVAVGGEDTLGVASKLYRQGVKTVGIPKTIDGDLVGTRQCEITSVPMKEVLDRLNLVDVRKYYDVERYNGKRSIL